MSRFKLRPSASRTKELLSAARVRHEYPDVAPLASGKSKVIARIPSVEGIATATAFDREGRLWVALRNGWSVARIDEAGDIAERLPLPVADPTGFCFGGSSGNDLFITSARPPEGANPLDGRLLRFT